MQVIEQEYCPVWENEQDFENPEEVSTDGLTESDCYDMLLACFEGDLETAIQFRNLLRKQLKKQRRVHDQNVMLQDYLTKVMDLISSRNQPVKQQIEVSVEVSNARLEVIFKKVKKRGFKGSKVTLEELPSHLSE